MLIDELEVEQEEREPSAVELGAVELARRLPYALDADGRLQTFPHSYQFYTLISEAPTTVCLKGHRAGYSSWVNIWLLEAMKACGPCGREEIYLCLTPSVSAARAGIMAYLRGFFCDMLGFADFVASPVPLLRFNKKAEEFLWPESIWGKTTAPTELQFYYAKDPESFAHVTARAAIGDEIGQADFKYDSWVQLQTRVAIARGQLSPVDGRPMGRILVGSTLYRLGWVEDVWIEFKAAFRRAWKEMCAKVEERYPCPDYGDYGPPNADGMAFKQIPGSVAAARRAYKAELKSEFESRWRRGKLHPELNVLRFDSTKNPAFRKEEMELARARLEPWLFQMRYCAKPTKPAGAIYAAWNPGKHIYKRTANFNPDKLPRSWPRRLSLDFGRKNFHALAIACDEDRDRHIIYGAYHEEALENAEHAHNLLAQFPDVSWCVGGNYHSEGIERNQMSAAGLITLAPFFKDLWVGIGCVNAAIRLDKIFIFEGVCPEFCRQMKNYARPTDDRGRVIPDAKEPEDKETFHWLDCLRAYATWWFNSLVNQSAILMPHSADARATRRNAHEPQRPAAAYDGTLRAGGGLSEEAANFLNRHGGGELLGGDILPLLDIGG
jgi:hypothetical protein